MGYINFYWLVCYFRISYELNRNPKEKLVKIPVPKFVFKIKEFYSLIYGNSKEYYRDDLYNSTKKSSLFFLTNLLIKSFT